MKGFFDSFKSTYVWGNLIAMAIVVVGAVMGVKFGLDVYTHHGESVKVPDVRKKSTSVAQQALEMRELKVVVEDTGYVKTLPPDCVLEQSPAPGTMVKTGHVIYLTVNALHTPTLTIPDIIDNSSLREATAKLSSMGFRLGEPKLVPGEKDWVYGILVDGRHVATGQKIDVGKTVIIEVGDGRFDNEDSINFVDPVPQTMENNEEEDPFEVITEPGE